MDVVLLRFTYSSVVEKRDDSALVNYPINLKMYRVRGPFMLNRLDNFSCYPSLSNRQVMRLRKVNMILAVDLCRCRIPTFRCAFKVRDRLGHLYGHGNTRISSQRNLIYPPATVHRVGPTVFLRRPFKVLSSLSRALFYRERDVRFRCVPAVRNSVGFTVLNRSVT